MRTRRLTLAVLIAAALTAPAAAADRTGFQLQVDGVLATPSGSLPSAPGTHLSDRFGSGRGFSLTGSVGLGRRIFGALRVSSFQGSGKSSVFRFSDLSPEQAALLPGSGPYDLTRELDGIPVHALLQYRRVVSKARIGFHVEAGAGIVSFTERVLLRSSSQGLLDIAGYQREPSYTLGGGIALPVPGNLDLVAGVRYDGTRTRDGAVWAKGDDPRFVTGALGLRYPRITH